jgi:hypothetical protein
VLCAHMLPVYILVHKLKSYIFSAGTWTEEGESNGSAQKIKHATILCLSIYNYMCKLFINLLHSSILFKKAACNQIEICTRSGCYVSSSECTTGE